MARKPKNLKVTECHDIIFDEFKKFIDPRPISVIPLQSMLMSSFAVFALKTPSLLCFDKMMKSERRKVKNLKNLFRLEKVPSDTQLRDVLDLVNYKQYRSVFKKLFAYVQRSKTLELFEFIKIENDPHYLAAVDGTGYFRSEKIRCENCLTAEHFDSDGNVTLKLGHNMLGGSIVNPKLNQVIPLCPEAIVRQDGSSKNDSEQVAFKRFIQDFKREHPKLKMIFLLDALYANKSIIKLLRENRYQYLIAVKNTKGHLFTTLKEGEETGETFFFETKRDHGEKITKTRKRTYRYRNQVKLHQEEESPFVNFVEVKEKTTWINKKGESKEVSRQFSFITDIKITRNNVEKLAEGGRARWKVENETFNTLKNRGYNFEHNYGHGDRNLSYNFIMSMFLAFFVDQIQEVSCLTFRKIISKIPKTYLWRKFESGPEWVELESWEDFYGKILENTS